jgi:hypothetical protein
VPFSIFLADDFRKMSLKIFEQEIRKNFKNFRENFDQKSQNHKCHMIFSNFLEKQ